MIAAVQARLSRTSPGFRMAVIGLLAFGLRVGFLMWNPSASSIQGDAYQYHSLATNIAAHGRYEDFFGNKLFRMPGYPMFLAAVYFVCGPSPLAVRLMQCLLGALACLALYAAARKLYGEPWGAACGLLSAVYMGALEACSRLLTESLSASLVAIFLWAWFCLDLSATSTSVVLAFILGLLCLVRPEFALFTACAWLLIPWLSRNYPLRRRLLWVPVLVALFSPWIIRNYLVFHRFIPGSTQSEAGLYMGLALPLENLKDIPRSARAERLPDLEQKAFYLKELRALLARTPKWKIARAYAFNGASLFYPFLPQYDWTYMLLMPFALWAAARARKQYEMRMVWLLVFSYVVPHLLAGGPVSRYRESIVPALILLAAAGARDLREKIGPGFKVWAGGYAAANLMIWLAAPQVRFFILKLKELALRG